MLETIKTKIFSLQNGKTPLIVFVCGMGGSGKSTFAKNLAKSIGSNCIPFHTDWYATYPTKERKKRIKEALNSKDSQKIEKDENPQNWYSWDKLKSDLNALSQTGSLHIQNAWNQENGEKDLTLNLKLKDSKNGIILCDGIYLLHPEITELADIIISLYVDEENLIKRAEIRDAHRSSPEYLAYKAHLTQKYDGPYYKNFEKNADMIIDNNDFKNPKITNQAAP